jgi:hypothetical protein
MPVLHIRPGIAREFRDPLDRDEQFVKVLISWIIAE